VLVGPSGCGKSTLLRLLAGLETVTAGEIRLDDRVVNDLPPQERNVAMVFQDYALYPFMTVARNLAFPLEMRRLRRAEIDRRVAAVAAMLDLDALLGRYPRELSGGQRQRVAMGRALVREPSVSLLDEPLSNLDARLRVDVRAQIAALQRQLGTTMLYVTHDQHEAMTLGHRIAVLADGRLQQVATPAELYARPANRFVAGFIGTPPMNILPARAEAIADGVRVHVQVAGQTLALPATGVDPARVTDLGIRPEALRLADDGHSLRGPVVHVEYLGHETLAHVDLAGTALVARLPGRHPARSGDVLTLSVDPSAVHLFGADGARL
jgi:ABC-type sugar transport system ATPase subunit